MIELPLLRVRSFALGNLAAAVFFAGFGAMLLSGVLLLTEVWGYSALKAGLALSPGPLMAAVFAIPSGRLGGQDRPAPGRRRRRPHLRRRLRLILATVGATPEYATTFLPGFMLGGAGVGMVLGTLPAAVTASLPPERFATGTAVFGMSRQLGSAIGVAALVALLNDTHRRRPARRPAARLVVLARRRPRHRGAGPRPSARSASPARPPQPAPELTPAARRRLSPTVGLEGAALAQPQPLVLGDLACSSASVISGAPRRRRISFCASIIWRMSSISFWASTSGERVGFQSTRSALEPG